LRYSNEIIRVGHTVAHTEHSLFNIDNILQSIETKKRQVLWLLEISLNSPGANGVLNAIFPFWAKMKTVIIASCDDFSNNFRAYSVSRLSWKTK